MHKKIFKIQDVLENDSLSVCMLLQVTSNKEIFSGHFDTLPVVPGVVLIDQAVALASQYIFDKQLGVYTLENIKFKQLLMPGALVKCSVEFKQNTYKLYFKFFNDESEFCSGRLVIENDES